MVGLWFLWTGVVIPAHTRGEIPLVRVGAGGVVERVFACPMCAMRVGGGQQGTGNGKQAPADKSGNCAICNAASFLSVGTGFVLVVPKAGVLGWMVMRDGAAAVYGVRRGLPVGSRAPPV
ncbi:MAG TPA: hypothetical protein VH253_16145 [Phycisphaerae bacterium]|nr:hypothetical protein [Phycisphaerae bacterium]